MDCISIKDRIEAFVDSAGIPDEAREHLRGCATCADRVRRARLLATELKSLPALAAPADLAAPSLPARRRTGRFVLRRAAAAMLLLGVGAALTIWGALGENGRREVEKAGYERLELRVVEGRANGALQEEFRAEETWGPDALMLLDLSQGVGGSNGG